MYQSALAAEQNTTDGRAGLAPHTFLSLSPGGWKSKVRVPAWLVSGESCVPGSEAAAFSLSPHRAQRVLVSISLLLRPLIPS